MRVLILSLCGTQSCFRAYMRPTSESTCNLGNAVQRWRAGHSVRCLQLCGPRCSAPWGELCPSLSWEHRKCHSVSFLLLHRLLATGQWFFSMLLYVWTRRHPEKPQEGPSPPAPTRLCCQCPLPPKAQNLTPWRQPLFCLPWSWIESILLLLYLLS